MLNMIIINLDREIKKNKMEMNRLRKANAECRFCAEMLKQIDALCKEFRLAVMEIEIISTNTNERNLLIEALLEAYTYRLEQLKTECVAHKVSNEMVAMLFDGLGR